MYVCAMFAVVPTGLKWRRIIRASELAGYKQPRLRRWTKAARTVSHHLWSSAQECDVSFFEALLKHEIRHWAQIATLFRLSGLKVEMRDFLFSPVLGGEFKCEAVKA
jgi:hypothetical protein